MFWVTSSCLAFNVIFWSNLVCNWTCTVFKTYMFFYWFFLGLCLWQAVDFSGNTSPWNDWISHSWSFGEKKGTQRSHKNTLINYLIFCLFIYFKKYNFNNTLFCIVKPKNMKILIINMYIRWFVYYYLWAKFGIMARDHRACRAMGC